MATNGHAPAHFIRLEMKKVAVGFMVLLLVVSLLDITTL